MFPLPWFIRGDPAAFDIPFMELFMFPFMAPPFWLGTGAIMFALGIPFMPMPCVRLLAMLICCCCSWN